MGSIITLGIKKMDIDLTGGFIASSTIIGSLYKEESNENTNN